MSYTTIDNLPQILAIIHNKDFVIHISFYDYLAFYESSHDI